MDCSLSGSSVYGIFQARVLEWIAISFSISISLIIINVKHIYMCLLVIWTSLVAQTVKHLPTMWETRVQSLGQEDLLEKETATHSIFLPCPKKGAQRNMGFPGGSDGKASAYNAGNLGSIPASGRSPGEGNGTPFQYSCLENPMDRRA